MNLRRSEIYVSGETRHRLKLLTELYPFPGKLTEGAKATSDAWAEYLLDEAIEIGYPLIGELEKQERDLRMDFLKRARGV